MNEILKQEIKRTKQLLKTTRDFDEVLPALEIIYTRITNRKDRKDSILDLNGEKYSLEKIFKAKIVKEVKKLTRKIKGGVIFEFINYETAPNGFLIIFNQFKDWIQTKFEIFAIKQN